MDAFIMTGKADSPFSGHLPDQHSVFLEAISQRPFLSVLASHGSFRSVTIARYEEEPVALAVEDVARLEPTQPSGPLIMLSCSTGEFARPQTDGPCLAEAFLAHPGGPVAVMSPAALVYPVTKYVMTDVLVDALRSGPATIGDYVLALQRRLCLEGGNVFRGLAARDARVMPLLEVNASLTPAAMAHVLAAEILSYNLLGDPVCPLRIPAPIPVEVSQDEGGHITASGHTPPKCTELIAHLIGPSEPGNTLLPDLSPRERGRRFEAANRPPTTLTTRHIASPDWHLRIALPPDGLADGARIRFLLLGSGQPRYHIYDPAAGAAAS
jgi:hypothetical protein